MSKYNQKEINNYVIKNLAKAADNETTLYVNYPFCINRCKYCIYHIDKYSKDKSEQFLEYYNKEILLYANNLKDFRFRELHIGGGTPNLTEPEALIEPLGRLADFKKIKHFVLEIFPKPNLKNYLEKIKKYHVTKIILGIQTLNGEILKNEHRYSAESVITECLQTLSKSRLSWSVDLIYGLAIGNSARDYAKELKEIIKYKPSGFHLYNIRYQKQNEYYGKSQEADTGSKYMDLFDYGEISNILKKNNYKLIGDEWCLLSDKKNAHYARKDSLYYGEAPTVGLGLGARSRSRYNSFINVKNLDDYCALIDGGNFPIEKLFDYKNKYYIVANILLAVNQSSRFDLKTVPKDASDEELKEVRLMLDYLESKEIKAEVRGSEIIFPRGQWTETIDLIEKYLKIKSGTGYFYKN